MKTYKKTLYKQWWKRCLVGGIIFLCLVLAIVLTGKFNCAYLFIPVFIIFSFWGIVKCPKCKCRLQAPTGSIGLDKVNYCVECGFDLNEEEPKEWARLNPAAEQVEP